MQKNIAIIGTFDTKSEEIIFMEKIMKKRGLNPILVDVGTLTLPEVRSDYSNKMIAQIAGRQLFDLIESEKRDEIIGMVDHGERISLRHGEKTIALTALGNTEPAAHRISELLGKKGFRVITFHASGAIGSACVDSLMYLLNRS